MDVIPGTVGHSAGSGRVAEYTGIHVIDLAPVAALKICDHRGVSGLLRARRIEGRACLPQIGESKPGKAAGYAVFHLEIDLSTFVSADVEHMLPEIAELRVGTEDIDRLFLN